MKTKNIKIGLVAALGGLAAAQNCDAQTGNSNDASNRSADSIRLEQRLKELSKTKYTGELAWGAMCYSPAMLEFLEHVCPYCGDTKKWGYGTWMFINHIEEIVTRIKTLGYDVVLDKTEFCPQCSKMNIEKPKLIFKIRYSTKSSYHIARSNIVNEYLCLLAFLSNQDKYSGETEQEYALYDNIAIIQKMTGLGKDLKIEKQ